MIRNMMPPRIPIHAPHQSGDTGNSIASDEASQVSESEKVKLERIRPG